jgi:hypothetical protein
MPFVVLPPEQKQISPPTGVHAELLVDISQSANALIKLVELEQSGVCDGSGYWVGSDPILNTARKLVALVEQRVSYGTPGRTG